jgi:hypothetical protein
MIINASKVFCNHNIAARVFKHHEISKINIKKSCSQRRKNERTSTTYTYQPLVAVAAGVNLLARNAHRQKRQQPCDQRSGGSGGQSLSAPQPQVVSASQRRGHSHHARNQGDHQERARHSVTCCQHIQKPLESSSTSLNASILHGRTHYKQSFHSHIQLEEDRPSSVTLKPSVMKVIKKNPHNCTCNFQGEAYR